MAATYLLPGQEVTIDNNQYLIDRYLKDELQLIEVRTKKATQINKNKILKKIFNGEMECRASDSRYVPEHIPHGKGKKVAALLEFYNEDLQKEMKIKRTFVEAYFRSYGEIRSKKVIERGLKSLWDLQWGKAPDPSTVARWIKRYVEAGRDIRALCPSHFLKGNRLKRYDPFIIEACHSAIRKVYLKPERGSINLTYTEAKRQIYAENLMRPEVAKLPIPSKALIASLVKELPAYDVYAARHGKAAADNKFRNAVNTVSVEKPLERVEVDHTEIDIIVVDPVSGVVLGRPWITLIIDVYSRCILGFSISFDPPSHMVVARALKMALLPKVNIQERWPIVDGQWPMFGLMQDLVADNGLEFHGRSLEDACHILGINISYCPRKKGWWKAVIERSIGTLNQDVTDGLAGRTFSSIDEKGDYQPQDKATLSIESLEQIIAKWVVDIYHETVHSTLGRKPRSVWEQEVKLEDIPIVTNVNELDAIMGRVESRRLSHKGIEINSLRYNNDELGAFRNKFGDVKDMTVKWDPEEMGHIHLMPDDGSLIKVPVIPLYQDYAVGISKYQHDHYRAYGKQHLTELDDDEQLFVAKTKLQDFAQSESKAVANSKKKLRRLSAKSAKTKSKAQQNRSKKAQIPNEILQSEVQNIPNFGARKSNRRRL